MEISLADKNRKEIRFARELIVDIDSGTDNDFEMISSVSDWTGDIDYGCLLYIPDTEFGGIVSKIKSSTSKNEIYISGDTWRGKLNKKVIKPTAGEDYKKVSGELNDVLRAQIAECGLGDLFVVPVVDTGITVKNFQFNRYCTLLEGFEKMLAGVEYRLDIAYVKTNEVAHVRLQALPVVDYSGTQEFSQDSKLDFTVTENRGGINHLVCLGKGELKDRVVRHLYVQADGSIGSEQFFFGVDENEEIYDNNNAEEEELISDGTKRLKERMNFKKFEVNVFDNIEQDLQIGDIIGGRDYITGISVKKKIVGKILTIKEGVENIEYRIEGDD